MKLCRNVIYNLAELWLVLRAHKRIQTCGWAHSRANLLLLLAKIGCLLRHFAVFFILAIVDLVLHSCFLSYFSTAYLQCNAASSLRFTCWHHFDLSFSLFFYVMVMKLSTAAWQLFYFRSITWILFSSVRKKMKCWNYALCRINEFFACFATFCAFRICCDINNSDVVKNNIVFIYL